MSVVRLPVESSRYFLSQNLDEDASDDSHDTTPLRYACPFGCLRLACDSHCRYHTDTTSARHPPPRFTSTTTRHASPEVLSFPPARVRRLACVMLTNEPSVLSRHQLSPYELDWSATGKKWRCAKGVRIPKAPLGPVNSVADSEREVRMAARRWMLAIECCCEYS